MMMMIFNFSITKCVQLYKINGKKYVPVLSPILISCFVVFGEELFWSPLQCQAK